MRDLIICDNFYSNPNEVRDFALSQDFNVDGNYPGHRTKSFLNQGIADYISKVVGAEVDMNGLGEDSYCGAYQYTTAADRTWIHADGWNDWAGVVYLTPDAPASGGTGIYYSADNIWILGRQQVKKGKEVKGYNFVINVEKSRFVKEKSKVPITVSWDGGIEQYSGLLEVALAGGYVTKPSMGWYAKVDQSTGEQMDQKYREKDTLTAEFWEPIFETTNFKEFLKAHYSIGHKPMLEIDLDEVIEEEAAGA